MLEAPPQHTQVPQLMATYNMSNNFPGLQSFHSKMQPINAELVIIFGC